MTAKSRASRRLCFEDKKRIMSLEKHPKSFGTFEKRAPGPNRACQRLKNAFPLRLFALEFASCFWSQECKKEKNIKKETNIGTKKIIPVTFLPFHTRNTPAVS